MDHIINIVWLFGGKYSSRWYDLNSVISKGFLVFADFYGIQIVHVLNISYSGKVERLFTHLSQVGLNKGGFNFNTDGSDLKKRRVGLEENSGPT